MVYRCAKWWRSDDAAQDIAEYAVLIAVVLIIVIGTATALGTSGHTLMSKAASALGKLAP